MCTKISDMSGSNENKEDKGSATESEILIERHLLGLLGIGISFFPEVMENNCCENYRDSN